LLARQGEYMEASACFQKAAKLGEALGHEYLTRARQDLAFSILERNDSLQGMRESLVKYPTAVIEEIVTTIESVADQVQSEHRLAFEERLRWLKQIAGERA
jgi:hypothetical protein